MRNNSTTVRADEQSVHDKAKELHDAILKHEQSKMTEKSDKPAVDESAPAATGDVGSAAILEALKALGVQIAALAPKKSAAVAPTEDDEPLADEQLSEPKHRRPTAAEVRTADAAMARAQARADSVEQAYGRRAPAPMSGETLKSFRLRLLRNIQPQSKLASFDLQKVDGTEFDLIEDQIFADAMAASSKPVVASGQLLERVTIDSSGRKISTFYGDPKTWMREFSSPGEHGYLTINTKNS